MPRWDPNRLPALRRHKARGLGVVTLSGRDVYLGSWPEDQEEPPPAVRAAYDREVAEWLRRGRRPALSAAAPAGPAGAISVAEVIARWLAWAEGYYRLPGGEPTSEVGYCRLAMRPLNHLFGELPARDFGPLKLKALREIMVKGYLHPEYGEQEPLTRSGVNGRCRRVVRMFRWAAAEELVPGSLVHDLESVAGLPKGRSAARETEPVRPAPPGDVEKALPHLRPPVVALVRLQQLTGMRPGEACRLRLVDLNRQGDVWTYQPARHKAAHHGRGRVVAVGPRAQALLLEWVRVRCPLCGTEGRPPRVGCRDGALCGPCCDRMDEAGISGPWKRCEAQDPQAPLFSPAVDALERSLDRRAKRKTPVQPSQRNRRKKRPKAPPRDRYDRHSYAQALRRACEKAGVPPFAPNTLRHARATEIRARYGLEAAQTALGHARADVTQVYAERDLGLAARIAREIG
jgi:integrase